MKYVKYFLLFVFVVAGAFFLLLRTDIFSDFIAEATVEVLKSEDILLLATNKVSLRVVSKAEEKHYFLGSEKVVLSVPVFLLYGFDLEKLDVSDVEVTTKEFTTYINIEMPPLELLSYEVDLSKLETLSEKGNPLMLLKNRLTEKSIREYAEKNIKVEAMRQAKEFGIEPDRSFMLSKLESKVSRGIMVSGLVKLGLVKVRLY
jgi:hypothetical protein